MAQAQSKQAINPSEKKNSFNNLQKGQRKQG